MKKTVVLFLKNEDIFDYLTFMIRVVSISTQSLKLSLKSLIPPDFYDCGKF